MSNLAPPEYDDLPVTPGTRSAAEAALTSNMLMQTASAGQAPPSSSIAIDGQGPPSPVTGRPPFPTRTSTNYIDAATDSAARASAASPPTSVAPRPRSIPMPVSPSDEDLAAQNAAAEAALLAEQAAAKRASVDMRSDSLAGVGGLNGGGDGVPRMLGAGDRQQSWSQQDMKRAMQEPLMKGGGPAQGYSAKGGGSSGY